MKAVTIILSLIYCVCSSSHAQQKKLLRSEIYIRDPYIFPDKKTNTYYMYSSSYGYKGMPAKRMGITVYKSKDLEHWEGPSAVFETGDGFWADTSHGCWAPEVHEYKGQYYLFATFTNKQVLLRHTIASRPDSLVTRRATVVLTSASPLAPFHQIASSAETPPQWMALDGTLYIENGKPYMVFCHEWLQVYKGTVEVVKMTRDLSAPAGKPQTLFKATEAGWVNSLNLNGGGYVTDGPALYKNRKGALLMLWSSFSKNGYAVGQAIAASGKISGPWKQVSIPLFDGNGGHPSIFKTFDGRLLLSIHQPNKGDIRAHLFELIEDESGLLKIKSELPMRG